MKMSLIYKVIASVYDLIDVIYFRNYKRSPRKAVLDTILGNEKILDLCTGTGGARIKEMVVFTNPLLGT